MCSFTLVEEKNISTYLYKVTERIFTRLLFFWQNSNRIICSAVFGFDEKLAVRSSYRFNQNNLVISSVDIQSVEPVDQRTRDALQKSVQLAIEITTNSQEAAARSETQTHTATVKVSHFYRQLGKEMKFNTNIKTDHQFLLFLYDAQVL